MTGFDVIVVGASIQPEVSGSRGLASVRVIGGLIRAQRVIEIINFHIAVQLVNGSDFFLLDSADGRFPSLRRLGFRSTRSFRKRFFLSDRVLLGGAAASLILREQLAGYYGSDGKLVTNKQGRDKQSSAVRHFKNFFEANILREKSFASESTGTYNEVEMPHGSRHAELSTPYATRQSIDQGLRIRADQFPVARLALSTAGFT